MPMLCVGHAMAGVALFGSMLEIHFRHGIAEAANICGKPNIPYHSSVFLTQFCIIGHKDPSYFDQLWVMRTASGYGLWDFRGLWDFTGNGVGGHSKPMGYHRLWVVTSMV
jgi:hypothetical protein